MSFKPIAKISILGAQAFALVFLCFLAGCNNIADDQPMRVSANAWLGYEPLFVAESQSFFEKGSVDLIEAPFLPTQEQAFRGGTIDASAVSLSNAFSLVAAGHDITIVLVLDWSRGADKIMASQKIESVMDLRGKRVGIEPGTVSSFLLSRALQNFALSPSDVTLVPMMYSDLTKSFLAGEIDAASVFGPQARLLKENGAHSIFDSSRTPSEILDVLVVRTAYLKKNPERVEQLVKGWLKAVDFLETQSHVAETTAAATRTPAAEATTRSGALRSAINLSGSAENFSFLESEALRLKTILSTRLMHHKNMSEYMAMDTPPKVDAGPFLRAANVEGS